MEIKKYTYLPIMFGFCLFVLTNCKSSENRKLRFEKKANKIDCSSRRIKNENQITWSRIDFAKIDKKYNQIQFCTYHPSIISQYLYYEFGPFDAFYVDEKGRSIVTLWKNVKIKGIDKNFTYGTTSYNDSQSSIIVYDENEKDMLAPESEYRDILIQDFTNYINTYTPEKFSKYYYYNRQTISPLYKKHF